MATNTTPESRMVFSSIGRPSTALLSSCWPPTTSGSAGSTATSSGTTCAPGASAAISSTSASSRATSAAPSPGTCSPPNALGDSLHTTSWSARQVSLVGVGHVGGGDHDDRHRDAEREGDRPEGGRRARLEPGQVPDRETGADREARCEPGHRPQHRRAGEEHGDGEGDDARQEEDRRHRLGVRIDAGTDGEHPEHQEGHGGDERAVHPPRRRRPGGHCVDDRHPGDGTGRPPRRHGGGRHGEPDAGHGQPQRDVPAVDPMRGGRLEGRRRCQPQQETGAGAGDGRGEADGGPVGDHGPAKVAWCRAGRGEEAELAHAAVGDGGEARPRHEAHEDHGDGGDDEHGDGRGGLLGGLPRLDEALARRDRGPEPVGVLTVGVDQQGHRLGGVVARAARGRTRRRGRRGSRRCRRPRSSGARCRPARRARCRGRRRRPR